MTTAPLPPLPATGRTVFHEPTPHRFAAMPVYTADQMQSYATQARADLEAENQRLREALQAIVQSWDNNTFCRERFVKSELGDYWAPASAMVNSETIAAARAALGNKT